LLSLPGIVLGSILVGVAATLFYPLKLVFGSGARVHSMCSSYARMLRYGIDAYARQQQQHYHHHQQQQQQRQQRERRSASSQAPTIQEVRERLVLQVPLGMGPGDRILVDHPRGSFIVTIPLGVPPGGSFSVELPPQAGPHVHPQPVTSLLSMLERADSILSGYCRICVAEVGCCCLPAFILAMACVPFILAIELLFPTLHAFIDGARAGALPRQTLLKEWGPSVCCAVHTADHQTSAVAFGDPNYFLVFGCLSVTSTAATDTHQTYSTSAASMCCGHSNGIVYACGSSGGTEGAQQQQHKQNPLHLV